MNIEWSAELVFFILLAVVAPFFDLVCYPRLERASAERVPGARPRYYLFGILFLWQFPHFHAIAWLYREDYERAGIRMLAVVRPNGKALRFEIMLALTLLAPITLAPSLMHMTGSVYTVIAVLLNVGFLFFGIQMCRNRTRLHARRLLLASVVYMPVLFAALVFDSPRWSLGG